MVFGPARLEHVEIFLLKIRQPGGIGGVKRVHQTVTKGIGIDVERRMDEMRDIGPERLIPVHEIKDIAQGLRLHRHPQRVDVIGGQFALGAGGVQFAFEIIERDLAHHGVDHILDLAGQQRLALGLGRGPVQQFAKGQHFAKDAGGFGQSQRGRGQQLALTRRQNLMHAVAQLMRQGHDIARFSEVVEHDIGVDGGHGRMGKGARCLARFHAGVDPALGVERLGDGGHARVKPGIGGLHRRLGIGP